MTPTTSSRHLEIPPSSRLRTTRLQRIFRRNKVAYLGIIIILLYVASAVLAPVLAPLSEECSLALTGLRQSELTPAQWGSVILLPPQACFLMRKVVYTTEPLPPNRETPMGVVEGYDIFHGILWGTRSLIGLAFIIVLVTMTLGTGIGIVSGYFGGRVDAVLMRFTDVVYAFPSLILSIILAAILGQGVVNVAVSFILVNWAIYARLVRGEVIRMRGLEYIEASRALGMKHSRIMLKHVLPNAAKPLLVLGILNMGTTPLQMSALAFLGIGTPPGYADWGRLVELARGWLLGLPDNPLAYWYVSFFPGLAILLYGLGWSLIGEALQDLLDVKNQK
jgi:peptide/nickel transport system permease protein